MSRCCEKIDRKFDRSRITTDFIMLLEPLETRLGIHILGNVETLLSH